MKLTNAERSILYWEHSILAELKPDDAEDHRRAMEILQHGYHEQLYDHDVLGLSEPLNAPDARFVYDVLELFNNLQFSYEKLSAEDRKGLDERDLRFPGFDGHHESQLMGFARFLVQRLGRWENLKLVHDFNSHVPTRQAYSRMLKVAPKIAWGPEQGYSADQIKAILAAWKPPGAGDAAE
jgi:uncharacterized protein YfbU (UPF0304 family)